MLPRKRLSTTSGTDDVGVDVDCFDQLPPATSSSVSDNPTADGAPPYALLPVHAPRKRKKTSWVWHHFLRGASESERNVCRHCLLAGDATSYPRTTGNSTLGVHLLAKHGIAKGELGSLGLAPDAPVSPVAVAVAGHADSRSYVDAAALLAAATAGVGDGDAPVSHTSHAVQPKAARVSVKRQVKQQPQGEPSQAADKSEIDDALLDLIVDTPRGLGVLESTSFRAFCQKLNPAYQPPARATLLATVDRQLHQALQTLSLVVQTIPGGVALTLDRWSTPGYHRLTLHWVSRDWQLNKCLLAFRHAPSPAFDASCVSELVVSALRRFHLTAKVRAITTDSDPELEASVAQVRHALQTDDDELAAQKSDAWHLRCVSHILHQCVAATLEKVAVPLANLRAVLKFIHDSDELRALYREVQRSGRVVMKDVPPLDVENKWISTSDNDAGLFAMIDEAYDVRDVLDVVCTSDAATALRFQLLQSQQQLSDADWRSLKSVRDFLEQAVAFTAVGEVDEFISASLLPLIYDSLQAHCKKTIASASTAVGGGTVSVTPLAKAAASAFLDVLQRHRRHLWNDLANLAQILDPRVANASVEAVAMKSEIRRTLVDQYGLDVQASSSSSSLYQTSEIPALPARITPTKQISSLFAAARQARNESQAERAAEDEVDAFFKFTAAADLGCPDVLEWWKSVGAQRFPVLSLLARDTLMIMGSALPPRLFTGSDQLVRRANAAVNLDKGLESATKVRAWSRLQ